MKYLNTIITNISFKNDKVEEYLNKREMRKLKKSHKNLMIIEASYIYCKRHNLDYETFINDVFMGEQFDTSEGSEFDNICKDLRYYGYFDPYNLIEITNDEYELCIDKFGEN